MQFVRSILFVLALASPQAGCFSYTRHDADEGRPYYYDQSYCGGPHCSGGYGYNGYYSQE
jgi:hypothetical protein